MYIIMFMMYVHIMLHPKPTCNIYSSRYRYISKESRKISLHVIIVILARYVVIYQKQEKQCS